MTLVVFTGNGEPMIAFSKSDSLSAETRTVLSFSEVEVVCVVMSAFEPVDRIILCKEDTDKGTDSRGCSSVAAFNKLAHIVCTFVLYI